MSVLDWANLTLVVNIVLWVWLLLVYGLLERGGGWLRVALLLSMVGIVQMLVRALLVLQFGEDYPGRDLLLLLGRLELWVAAAILLLTLHLARRQTRRQRATRRTESGPGAPRGITVDS